MTAEQINARLETLEGAQAAYRRSPGNRTLQAVAAAAAIEAHALEAALAFRATRQRVVERCRDRTAYPTERQAHAAPRTAP